MSNLPKGWKLVQLNDIVKFNNGKGHEQYIDDNGDYIVVNSKFISTNGEICKYSNENLSPLKKGDITLVMSDIPNGRALAKCYLIEEDNKYTLNQRICSLEVKNENNEFLFYKLNRNQYFLKFNDGVNQTNLRKNEVLECPIELPPLEEQKKIADILSTVDKKIAFVEENINATEELKKSLMQKLLTEGIGHTEFKDSELGRIPKSWEISNIENIFNIFVGRDLKEDRFSKEKTDTHIFPVFSNTVDNNGFYGYYDYEEFNGSSLTVVGRGIGVGTAFTKNGSYGAIGRLLVLFPQKGIKPHFYTEYINFKIKIFSESSGIPQLTGAQIKNYKCPIPPLEEQKQIAEILSTVDKKLENLKEKKQSFEELKKGLMQKLLTGEVRV